MTVRTLSIVAAVSAASLAAIPAQADMMANWTFETSGPSLILADNTTSPNATAEGGVFAGSSIASGFHTLATTDWSSPSGNGSIESFSANAWSTGDYWQFSTSTTGYQNISISWDQTRSATGPVIFDLQYSVDGTNFFTLLDDYSVLESSAANGGTWNTTTYIPNYTFAPQFGPALLDNQATIYFRMVSVSLTTNAAGTNRIDNVIISGDAIPGPGAMALLGLSGLMGRSRRRR